MSVDVKRETGFTFKTGFFFYRKYRNLPTIDDDLKESKIQKG